MAIAMTSEQYWYGDPLMVRAFYKAEKIRRELSDEKAWLQGIYFKLAIESSVGNAFRAKGATPEQYPEVPMLTAERQKAKQTEDQQKAFARLYMMQMVEAGKNWGRR